MKIDLLPFVNWTTVCFASAWQALRKQKKINISAYVLLITTIIIILIETTRLLKDKKIMQF